MAVGRSGMGKRLYEVSWFLERGLPVYHTTARTSYSAQGRRARITGNQFKSGFKFLWSKFFCGCRVGVWPR